MSDILEETSEHIYSLWADQFRLSSICITKIHFTILILFACISTLRVYAKGRFVPVG